MLAGFCLLFFGLMIMFFLLGMMMDLYLYLYSPQRLLIKRNPQRSLMFLLGSVSVAAHVCTFLYLTGASGWRNFIPFIFVLIPLWYHMYCIQKSQFMLVDINTGEIEMSDSRKIKIADVLYLELYGYDQGGYTYEQLCFVLQSLKKVDISEKYLGIEVMIKELTSFLMKKMVDSRS